LKVRRKPDRSPVTAADHAIEERLRRAIERQCPGEPIIGEEFGRSGRPGTTFWTVDPIDGTRAFASGLPSWGILVGRVERGVPVLGLCDFPLLGLTLAVAPGVPAYVRAGAQASPLPRPRPVRLLADAVIFHGGSHWWAPTPYARGFAKVVKTCFLERAYGDCYGYLWALLGCADVVFDYGVKIWDMAPFAALARATGRVLTDFSNRPSFTGPETVLASPRLARLVTTMLKRK